MGDRLFDTLQGELKKFGIESLREFRLPGTGRKIDLFIPALPRAAIEVTHARNAREFTSAIELMMNLRTLGIRELGSAFVPILIACRDEAASQRAGLEIPKGLEVIFLDGDSSDVDRARMAATGIKKILDCRRTQLLKRQLGATLGLIAPMLASAAAPTIAFGGARLAKAMLGMRTPSGDGVWLRAQRMSELTEHPSVESVQETSQQAASILSTFEELAPDAYKVAAHEMRFLVEEFASGHFTACAMRAGRCVESMVYELSSRWSIALRDPVFGRLDEVRKNLDHLGETLGDFEAAPEDEREQWKMKLERAAKTLHSQTLDVMVAVQKLTPSPNDHSRGDGGPRPVIALLKRMRKRYGRLDGVADSLGDLLNAPERGKQRSPIERILEVRNRAAHAHVDGKPEEVDEATIRALLDDINLVLLRLSNVGIAIQQAPSQP